MEGATAGIAMSTGMAKLKLRLEDQGEGWFWDRPAIEVDVIGETWVHSRRYHKVRLEPPLKLKGSGAPTQSGLHLETYGAAWLSARWVGHEFGSTHDTSTFLWPAPEEDESGPPPEDTPPSARVMCREVR
jgi:hypothetical protein